MIPVGVGGRAPVSLQIQEVRGYMSYRMHTIICQPFPELSSEVLSLLLLQMRETQGSHRD